MRLNEEKQLTFIFFGTKESVVFQNLHRKKQLYILIYQQLLNP